MLLLECILSTNRVLTWLMNLANLAVVHIMRPNINRRTVENVIKNRLGVEKVTDLGLGIFKLIEVKKQ